MGSPPRVREKRLVNYYSLHWLGITPACAGKTHATNQHAYRSEDHPRVCGKNVSQCFVRWKCLGSPPRVREKLIVLVAIEGASRITPACAGKTGLSVCLGWILRDHPRVCGKNMILLHFTKMSPGSPPRVREKLSHPNAPDRWIGITPACAGKTPRHDCSLWL